MSFLWVSMALRINAQQITSLDFFSKMLTKNQ
jgi:hypothetical protein